jgi:aryl-alcohol dehydrogenase
VSALSRDGELIHGHFFGQSSHAVHAVASCGIQTGAPAFGTEVSLDMNSILVAGRTLHGIVEGDSVPGMFLPQLVELRRQGTFPVDRLMTFYDFDQINEAAAAAEAGTVVKPVLRMR